MMWALIAMGAPLFWTAGSLFDQYGIRHGFKDGSHWSYGIGVWAASWPIAATFLLIWPELRYLALDHVLIVGFGTAFSALSYTFYGPAVRRTDIALVMPVVQTWPLFTLLFTWIFLGEEVPLNKVAAGCVIVLAAIAISIKPATRKVDWVTVGLLTASTSIYSVQFVWMRIWAKGLPWYEIAYCFLIVFGLISFLLMLFLRKDRDVLFSTIKREPKQALSFLLMKRGTTIGAECCVAASMALAPAAFYVGIFTSLQTFTLFIASGMLGLIWPQFYEPLRINRWFFYRIFCVAVIVSSLIYIAKP